MPRLGPVPLPPAPLQLCSPQCFAPPGSGWESPRMLPNGRGTRCSIPPAPTLQTCCCRWDVHVGWLFPLPPTCPVQGRAGEGEVTCRLRQRLKAVGVVTVCWLEALSVQEGNSWKAALRPKLVPTASPERPGELSLSATLHTALARSSSGSCDGRSLDDAVSSSPPALWMLHSARFPWWLSTATLGNISQGEQMTI